MQRGLTLGRRDPKALAGGQREPVALIAQMRSEGVHAVIMGALLSTGVAF
ncbi:MAG TPA: hypothetical protein VFH51_07245 [Myxococcota bacterium]|nr:hypothetical protein [Myxococcota bacterium]